MSNKSIRIQGEGLFDNFIVRTVLLDSEVSVRLHSGTVVKGFITGIDEGWLQVTETQKSNPMMVQLSTIQELSRTGRRVANLPKDSREMVKSMTHAIKNRCRDISAAGQRTGKVA